MHDILEKLGDKQRRGSKPRCHWLTHGDKAVVAERLTKLLAPWGKVTSKNKWLPDGFENTTEAELIHPRGWVPENIPPQLKEWWLFIDTGNSRTPNFDIAGTCDVVIDSDLREGLFLIEAKAHSSEITNEEKGKSLNPRSSENSFCNHIHIGRVLADASAHLQKITRLPWALSRDSHYQMSNRFAWAWKLTDLGIPVILVYLGFLNAKEMDDQGELFTSAKDWEDAVKTHSQNLVPAEAWEQPLGKPDVPLIPLIRSMEIPFDQALPEDSGEHLRVFRS
ncbi:MAG: hypothetical protein JXL20_01970 [Deltaproteobacteria bacterium]|nr:hypothetical protein [Deltaproteobacteria bacterium]